jgi:uncharacterized protein
MTNETFEIRWAKGRPLAEGGYPGLNPRTENADGIICEYDVAVPMRDGVKIRVDIFRPETECRSRSILTITMVQSLLAG